jgi:hypothetical protein
LAIREDGFYLDDYLEVFGDDGDELWHTERIRGVIQIEEMAAA